MITEYAFEMTNGSWHHRNVREFRDEQHAKDWAKRCGWKFKGKFTTQANYDAPGSARWCETYADNH
jgi:hypothetical protein